MSAEDKKGTAPSPTEEPSKKREDPQLRVDRHAFHSLQARITELTAQVVRLVDLAEENAELLHESLDAIKQLTALIHELKEMVRTLGQG